MSQNRPLRFRGWQGAPTGTPRDPGWYGSINVIVVLVVIGVIRSAGWVTGWHSVALFVVIACVGLAITHWLRRRRRRISS